jgi:hypothetical protein
LLNGFDVVGKAPLSSSKVIGSDVSDSDVVGKASTSDVSNVVDTASTLASSSDVNVIPAFDVSVESVSDFEVCNVNSSDCCAFFPD